MKPKCYTLLVMLLLGSLPLHAQGTFFYDQESSSDETDPISGVRIQFYGTVGQSFTPSLSTVGFIRIKLFDIVPDNALGATLAVNLRSNAINGPLMGTTTSVVLSNGFAGSVNFYFASAIPVVPNTTYFFETVVQSGDDWGMRIRSNSQGDVNYPGGVFYGGLTPASGNDAWFREGIIVPEPSVVGLMGMGVALVLWRNREHR